MSIEKAVRSMRPRKLKSSPLQKPFKIAGVTEFKTFSNTFSMALMGAAYADPDGVDEFHPVDMDDASLGRVARKALMASRFIDPDHPDRDRIDAYFNREQAKIAEDRLKKQAGLKTLKALYNGAGHVGLSLIDGQISLNPRRYSGGGSWGGIGGQEPFVLPPDVSDAAFGRAIREALEVSRVASAWI